MTEEKITTTCPGCRAKFSVVAAKRGRNYQCSQCGIPFVLGWDEGIKADEPELIGPTSNEEYPPYPLLAWINENIVIAVIGAVLFLPMAPFAAVGVGIHYAIWAIDRHQTVTRNQKKAGLP